METKAVGGTGLLVLVLADTCRGLEYRGLLMGNLQTHTSSRSIARGGGGGVLQTRAGGGLCRHVQVATHPAGGSADTCRWLHIQQGALRHMQGATHPAGGSADTFRRQQGAPHRGSADMYMCRANRQCGGDLTSL